MDFIKECYQKKMPLGQALHRKAMDYFKEYLIIGGMPQVVSEYIATKDFDKALKKLDARWSRALEMTSN